MRYYEDFEIGDVIETRRRTITEADIVNFCGFSGDWFPLHSDVEYAEKSVFGERIAHGMLVMSVATGLLPLNDIAIVAFYGMDKVRFRAPTKIGDTLRLQVNITGKEDKGEMGGLVTFDMYVKNQKDEDAAVSIMKVMVAKKKGA